MNMAAAMTMICKDQPPTISIPKRPPFWGLFYAHTPDNKPPNAPLTLSADLFAQNSSALQMKMEKKSLLLSRQLPYILLMLYA